MTCRTGIKYWGIQNNAANHSSLHGAGTTPTPAPEGASSRGARHRDDGVLNFVLLNCWSDGLLVYWFVGLLV